MPFTPFTKKTNPFQNAAKRAQKKPKGKHKMDDSMKHEMAPGDKARDAKGEK